MKPKLVSQNVVAKCPNCQAVANFESQYQGSSSPSFHTQIIDESSRKRTGTWFYSLLRCANCGRGGMSEVWQDEKTKKHELKFFWPPCPDHKEIPDGIPEEIQLEFREAELCMSFKANRAASALFRSTLERTLKANGYLKKGSNLKQKINMAADDGIITAALRQRAHDNIRDLGNDVLHDDYRKVIDKEVISCQHYVQRILECFYDSRTEVLTILKKKGRLKEEDEQPE